MKKLKLSAETGQVQYSSTCVSDQDGSSSYIFPCGKGDGIDGFGPPELIVQLSAMQSEDVQVFVLIDK